MDQTPCESLSDMNHLSDFLYPNARYRGSFKPKHLIFNANLQEFSQRVSYLCSLESAGKLPPEEVYEAIEALWQQLKTSKTQLGIDDPPS